MRKFYEEITLRALADTPRLISSNWIAVLVSIVAFVATFIIKVRRQRRYKEARTWREKLTATQEQWVQNAFDGSKVILCIWVFLFAISLARTLFQDHKNIAAERDTARRERDGLRTENDALRSRLPQTQEMLRPQIAPSQLDTLIETNRHLSKGDRERLANALFDFAQVLDQANTLWGKANQEGAQLNQAWGNGSIAKDFESHRNKLHEIDSSARDFAKSFPQIREKWKYYANQMNYIFGDNPDNNGPNAVINAVEAYSNYLDRWVTIQNKDERTILELFEPVQNQFSAGIRSFALWKQDCDRRLQQMKNSIQ